MEDIIHQEAQKLEAITLTIEMYKQELDNKCKQLATTQQALDTAVEALGEICGRGGYMPTTDFREQTRIMQRIARAALASIKE